MIKKDKMNKNKWIIIVLTSIAIFGALIFLENMPFLIEEEILVQEETGINYQAWCDNANEAQTFEKPIPIEWTARFEGCLVSCQGASFTKTVDDGKYPRFAGYYPDGKGGYDPSQFNPLPERYQNNELILKISGDWIGIQDDHPQTVFDGKCVPIVDIKEIEIVH